jgi:hypothetical protein
VRNPANSHIEAWGRDFGGLPVFQFANSKGIWEGNRSKGPRRVDVKRRTYDSVSDHQRTYQN